MYKIVDIIHGSRLYGTSTPKSDTDIKSLFLPTEEEILLGRIPKTCNVLGYNTDEQAISLHYFFELARQGQTMALEMLFAPQRFVTKDKELGWIWDALVFERNLFLSKTMKAFIGYARGQAAKYSLKGSRLSELKAFKQILDAAEPFDRMERIWHKLPREDERKNSNGIRELQIGGKWFGETTRCTTVAESLDAVIARYGNRSLSAAESGGKDWKALAHAVRVSKEVNDLATTGHIQFPLSYAPLLRDIRQGKYSLEEVQDMLDRELQFAEFNLAASSLPEKVNGKRIDQLLLDLVRKGLKNESIIHK